MKIYIETEMTELPKGCLLCKELAYCRERQKRIDEAYNNGGYSFNVLVRDNETRPEWCPLRTGTEISEKAKESKAYEKAKKELKEILEVE